MCCMDLAEYLLLTGQKQRAFAKKIGRPESDVSTWVNKKVPVPVKYCRQIVEETNGMVRFRDLRPDDYMIYWPV